MSRAGGNLARALAILLAVSVPAFAGSGAPTVVAFGDSLTAGYGLPAEDGFVPQLQAWLDSKGAAATVLNAGVSGDTTAGGRARLDWALTPDVDAMILTLGGNDLLRGIAPEEARANLDAILDRTDARGIPVLIVPMVAPGNYGPDYKAAFDAIYADLAGEHGALLAAPFLAPILEQPDRDAAFAAYVQPDGLHPNAEGVTLIVGALGPAVLDLLERLD